MIKNINNIKPRRELEKPFQNMSAAFSEKVQKMKFMRERIAKWTLLHPHKDCHRRTATASWGLNGIASPMIVFGEREA